MALRLRMAGTVRFNFRAIKALSIFESNSANSCVSSAGVHGRPLGRGPSFILLWKHIFEDSPLSDVTPHVLRHSFASIANDLGFTEVTIAALVGHAKGSVTSKYIHTLDTALIMAADTISGYIQGLLDGIEFKQTAYALDRDSRKAALARFLKRASGGDPEEAEEERRLAA